MKEKILETITKLRGDGINFKETPPLFTWSYDEEPNIQIQMLLLEVDKLDGDVQH